MSTDGLFEIAKSVSPQSAREYAKANGWEQVKEGVKGRIYLFRHSEEKLRQLIVPMDATTTDYAEMILEAASKLAAMEERPLDAVLNDLLLPNADILRFRLVEPEAANGSVPLQDGINLLEGAKKALLAAACSVVSPRSHHPRMSRTEADSLLASCKLGQTERGSYTMKIECPLEAVEEEAPLLQGHEPFVRRTTKLLLQSSQRIVQGIERDEVETIYEEQSGQPVISSNLCDALLQMQSVKDDATLSLSAKWASIKPEPASTGIPTEVRFNPDYFPVISDIYTKLRPAGEERESIFVATVETLNGDIGPDGRRAGDVGLWVFHEDETLPTRVNLNANEYEIADRAHMTGGIVVLKGVLHRGRRVHKITKIEVFKPLEEASSGGK
jgi:hypothetical protein